MTNRSAIRSLLIMQVVAPVLMACVACQTAFALDAPLQDFKMSSLLQVNAAHQDYGDYFAGQSSGQRTAELRMDMSFVASGAEAVLKPRLRAIDVDPAIPGVPEPRRFSFTEAYLNKDISDANRLTIGKRYLGWGTGLLYSPTNRLFPDNGAATPRQEIDGKWLAMVGSSVGERVRTTLLIADPYIQKTPGVDRSGVFALARIESIAREDGELTWGAVGGGGGGYRPYVGGYAQAMLGNAWTIGAEWSASRGYAAVSDSGTGLRADEDVWRADGLLTLRYGLPSGGEWGVELVHNGFYRSDAERNDPRVALFPPAATTQTRYAVRAPLAEKNYLHFQLNLTELFGDRRWALFVRHLEALQDHGRMDFAELAYSPGNRVTLYLGVTATTGRGTSTLVRAIDRAAYVTAEIYI
jgi:hypothetical protein